MVCKTRVYPRVWNILHIPALMIRTCRNIKNVPRMRDHRAIAGVRGTNSETGSVRHCYSLFTNSETGVYEEGGPLCNTALCAGFLCLSRTVSHGSRRGDCSHRPTHGSRRGDCSHRPTHGNRRRVLNTVHHWVREQERLLHTVLHPREEQEGTLTTVLPPTGGAGADINHCSPPTGGAGSTINHCSPTHGRSRSTMRLIVPLSQYNGSTMRLIVSLTLGS